MSRVSLAEVTELSLLGDARGSLVAIESHLLPFEIKRVYYIYGTQPNVVRGLHAHRSLDQVAVCVNGSCIIDLDDGSERQEVLLDKPNLALRIRPMIWHEMRAFSPGAVLMVLAAERYDEADYIRSYDEFSAIVGRSQ